MGTLEGEVIPSDNPQENLLLMREAIGVVVCLIPFNFPVYTLLRKIAPALITGNTVVVRPSNNTPCSAFEIAHAVLDAGLPAGAGQYPDLSHVVAAGLHPSHGGDDHPGRQRRGRPQGAGVLPGAYCQVIARIGWQDPGHHRAGCQPGAGSQ
jgi:hypothetical protein